MEVFFSTNVSLYLKLSITFAVSLKLQAYPFDKWKKKFEWKKFYFKQKSRFQLAKPNTLLSNIQHCISLSIASENLEMPVNLISFHMNFPSWIQPYNQTKPPLVCIEWVTRLFNCHPWESGQLSIILLSNREEKVISRYYTRRAFPFLSFYCFKILLFHLFITSITLIADQSYL